MHIKLIIITITVLSIKICLIFADIKLSEPCTQTFLSEYYNDTATSHKGYSKLLYAVEKGYRNIAFKLLESGENPNYQHPTIHKISTPFILAIYQEDNKLVEAMIKNGADVNLSSYILLPEGSNNLTPLMVAVRYNSSANITKILCATNQINFGILNYELSYCFAKTDIEKFMFIAEVLPNNCMDNLLLSSFAGYLSSENNKTNILKITQYLIDRGFPLQNDMRSSLPSAIKSGHKELIEYILALGAEIDYIPTHPLTEFDISQNPLIAAIRYYHTDRRLIVGMQSTCNQFMLPEMEPLLMLLDAGAKVNFSMKRYIHPTQLELRHEGFSPLTYAIKHHLIDVVSLLIAYGGDVNMRDNSGKTPLIWAVEVNNLSLVKILLAYKANIKLPGTDGRTPIEIACSLSNSVKDSSRYKPILDALIEAEAQLFDYMNP